MADPAVLAEAPTCHLCSWSCIERGFWRLKIVSSACRPHTGISTRRWDAALYSAIGPTGRRSSLVTLGARSWGGS
jgi:hypothetical protein